MRSNQNPGRSLRTRPRVRHMSLRDKLDARRLTGGAMILGAIALAWAIERPRKLPTPAMDTYPSGWTVDPDAYPQPAGILRIALAVWWRAVLLETYQAMNNDRLLAVDAGVVFYALLAIFRPSPPSYRPTDCSQSRAPSRTTWRCWRTSCRQAASRSSASRSSASPTGPAGSARDSSRVLSLRCGAPTPASRH